MAFPNDRTYSFDIGQLVSDNAAAYTASGFLQVGGATGSIDLGGNQGVSPVQVARGDFMAVFDVTALDITSGNETYNLDIVVSNSPSFASGNAIAASVQFGKGASLRVANSGDSVIGRYEVGFTNQVAGTIYEFAAVFLTVAGTTPSVNILGFIATLPEP